MTAPKGWFSGRNLTIKNIVAVIVFLFVTANVFYTSIWMAFKRNSQTQIEVFPRSLNATFIPNLNPATRLYVTAATVTGSTRFPPPEQCPYVLNMTRRKRNYVPTPVDPPWKHLLTNYRAAIASKKNLYVWACNPQRRRKFGNQLFNFAAVFGVAWRNKRIPYWTVIPTHVSAFQHRLIIDENYQRNAPETNRTSLKEKAVGIYDNRSENLPKRNICLTEFTQSYKYFVQAEDQLRIDLTFKPSILSIAREWLQKVTPSKWQGQDFVRVVIHVRRRDYTNPAHTKEGWTQPTLGYFQRAMSYFTDCLERVQFIVLSDGMWYCKKYLVPMHTDVVLATGRRHSAAVDLAIASLCDHGIVTIGSFGWWAAWLTNGIAITNKDVPRPRSVLSRRIHREDYYKPEWISL